MGYNSVVSGHPKSTRIPQVDGLSTGSPDLGCLAWYQSLGKRLPRELECGYPQVSPEISTT